MKLTNIWRNFIEGNQQKEETEFLPAILEVTETPPSPVGRLVLWSLIALLTIGLLWSIFGHIDEMAVAEGKIIPNGQVKAVQVKNKGIIKEILVSEGDYVQEGQPLINLDPTSTGADYASLNKRLAYFRLDIQRLEAELADKEFHANADDILSAQDAAAETMLYRSRRGQYTADLEAAKSTVNQKRAALRAARENYAKYQEMYDIAQDKENRLATLVSENAVAEFQLLDQRAQRIEYEKNSRAEAAIINQTTAELAEAEKKMHSIEESYRKDVMTALVEARKQYYAIEEEIKKADEDSRLSTITAPCDGRVYNLGVHTVGGIVTDAQTLMMIVPKGASLEFEVWADNKDIGFIKTDQEAEVKIATYNFQKFGVIKANVKKISPDAASDEKDPTTFEKYRLILDPQDGADKFFGEDKPLSPGMHITAEIKIKKKRIIDFFLEPFRKYINESLRER